MTDWSVKVLDREIRKVNGIGSETLQGSKSQLQQWSLRGQNVTNGSILQDLCFISYEAKYNIQTLFFFYGNLFGNFSHKMKGDSRIG